jgi:hypothetical protein
MLAWRGKSRASAPALPRARKEIQPSLIARVLLIAAAIFGIIAGAMRGVLKWL